MKDTIRAIDSKCYGPDGELKDSVDQDTERLGLEKGQPLVYQTANGAIRAWQTLLDEIRLGDLRVGPVRASINPGFSGEDILLGMSFLKQLDFSQQGNTLTLKQRSGD